MAVIVHIPWYATVFRGDKLADALAEISAVSLRYGATDHRVYRYDDDRYKFLQIVTFDDKLSWERYWDSPEFRDWRIANMTFFQVPVVYAPAELVTQGEMRPELVTATDGPSEAVEGGTAA